MIELTKHRETSKSVAKAPFDIPYYVTDSAREKEVAVAEPQNTQLSPTLFQSSVSREMP